MKQLLVLISVITGFGCFAQQIPHMSQWSNHQFAINPAHAGIKTCLEVQSTLRGQWINMDGAPISGWATISAPLQAKRKKYLSGRHGLGGIVNYDQLGAFKQISLQLAYAGHFNFTKEDRLSLGLAFGATQLAFDIEKAKPLFADPRINGSAVELKPTATFGAWWNGKNYYAGFSLYQMIPQKWKSIGSDAKFSMHAMVSGGYRMPLNQEWSLLPAAYIGFAKAAPMDFQLQALVDYRSRLITGLGFRNTDAVIGFLGFRFEERWRIMYSYDFILSPLRSGTFHSHELTIGFSPCRTPSSDQQLCPLFE
ncbi:MAG TPA: PorP/SprF family type IX secretion system membrane protein [Fluviicola sp.]|nr:PorP/SprF family type IX secretion system membrane protein [Fluviicola sp.]